MTKFFFFYIFDFLPPHFVHYYKKVIQVKFGHDYSPLSRATRGLNISEKGLFCHFLTIFKKILHLSYKMYKTYIIDIYIFNKKHIYTISLKSIISQKKNDKILNILFI
jgi:hypothetical protein